MVIISEHISYKEGVRSDTARRKGIRNIPNDKQLEAMRTLAKEVFEPLRRHFREPIRVNSFFRSLALNKMIGGSKTSQHCKGEAIDLDGMNGISNKQLYDYIKDNLEFDQLIWEFGTDQEPDWIHVSYTTKRPNRKQLLRATRKAGKTIYLLINGEKEKGIVAVNTVLNVRELASSESNKIGALQNGVQVIILEKKQWWLKVKTDELEGWVSTRYIKRN